MSVKTRSKACEEVKERTRVLEENSCDLEDLYLGSGDKDSPHMFCCLRLIVSRHWDSAKTYPRLKCQHSDPFEHISSAQEHDTPHLKISPRGLCLETVVFTMSCSNLACLLSFKMTEIRWSVANRRQYR